MATRRARIKAIAALPVRRKNVDVKTDHSTEKVSENNSEKQNGISNNLTCVMEKPLLHPADKLTEDTLEQNEISNHLTDIRNALLAPAEKATEDIFTKQNGTPNDLTDVAEKPFLDLPEKHIEILDKEIEIIHNYIESTTRNATEKGVSNIVSNGDASSIVDDYNPPSIPESVQEEAIMDGIVPLQPAQSTPKPIDVLKKDIISENAEVSFDPIVPLPSPNRIRPKLRPVPRLGPFRRNSIQGSASESEDESRRVLLSGGAPTPTRQGHDSHTPIPPPQSASYRDVNRVRHDSVCSSVSQTTIPVGTPSSPLKEKSIKTRREDNARRALAARRRLGTLPREKLTMYDLIFYNPTSNPMVVDEEEKKAKALNAKVEEERNKENSERESDDESAEESAAAPVPQLKLGANGEIILDEKSLVIKQSQSRKLTKGVVREGTWSARVGRYSRSARTKQWSVAETVRFYRALAAIGTDFAMMVSLFPGRTRKDLKLKFKKEERINPAQVDMAFNCPTTWDVQQLEKDFKDQREEEARKAEERKQSKQEMIDKVKRQAEKSKQMGIKSSKGQRAAGHEVAKSVMVENSGLTGDEFYQIVTKKETGESRQPVRTYEKRRNQTVVESLKKTPQHSINSNQDSYTITSLYNRPQSNGNLEGNLTTTHVEHATSITKSNSLKTPEPSSKITCSSKNITSLESGSIVLLTVSNPSSPINKVVQSYISNSNGCLTPVALPSTILNSVVEFMDKGTPKNNLSEHLSSNTGVNQDMMPNIIQLSPRKRIRHSSYTITQL